MVNRPKPLVLLILDGFGWTENTENNAIAMANTPNWDRLKSECPLTLLDCSGKVVGLPDQQMGNSEVGHLHIGSGRFVPQELSRLNIAIDNGEFFENKALVNAVETAKSNDKALHIFGLLSSGGVHSHINHIIAMVRLAAQRGLTKVYVHAFLDGRDVAPKSAGDSIRLLEDACQEIGAGRIVSIIGRFYVMDRDNRWERVEQAYRLIVDGNTDFIAESALEGLQQAYARDESDEFVEPTAITGVEGEIVTLDSEDSVVFMNFRADRAREISRAITETDFTEFSRTKPAYVGCYTTLTRYHQNFPYPVAYEPIEITNGLGEVLSDLGMKQLRLSETEKYAHVTFFMNGGIDEPFEGEDRILIQSPNVKTYDMQPEMSAPEVTDELVSGITGGQYDVIICNYANCDMVGHTGVIPAAVKAVEAVDASLGRVAEALNQAGGQMLMTADHGNIEKMVNAETGEPHTAHTNNLVPLIYFGGKQGLKDGGSLSDLAPTMLDILDVDIPAEMTGHSLLKA